MYCQDLTEYFIKNFDNNKIGISFVSSQYVRVLENRRVSEFVWKAISTYKIAPRFYIYKFSKLSIGLRHFS